MTINSSNWTHQYCVIWIRQYSRGGIPKYFPLGSFENVFLSLKSVAEQLKLKFCDSEFTLCISSQNIWKKIWSGTEPRFIYTKNSALSLTTGIQVINTFKWWWSKLFTHEDWISYGCSIYDIPNCYRIYSDTELQCFHQYELGCHKNVNTLTISLVKCQKTYIFPTNKIFCNVW